MGTPHQKMTMGCKKSLRRSLTSRVVAMALAASREFSQRHLCPSRNAVNNVATSLLGLLSGLFSRDVLLALSL